MTTPLFPRARRLTLALAALALPMLAFADATPPPAPAVHPWKAAFVRRLASEGMEGRELRERLHKEAMRQWKKMKKARARGTGLRARPATPDALALEAMGTGPTLDRARRFGTATFPLPANTLVNDPTGDDPDACQSEMSVAAFGDIVVAAWNDGQAAGNDLQGWGTSADGGVTWVDRGNLPHPAGVLNFHWASDPSLTVNEKTGAFYFTALCDFSNNLGSRAGVAVIKGRWNGTTIAWGNPVIVHETTSAFSEIADKNWCVADSVTGRVYLTYSQFTAGNSRIMFQAADSNVVAWSAPLQISFESAQEIGFVQGSRPVVDGTGRVYVVYYLIGQGFEDFYRVRRSDNLGASFQAPVTAASLYTNFNTGPPGFNRDVNVNFSGIAVDRSHGPNRGRLYLSWAESLNWLDEVFDIGFSGDRTELEPNGTVATATPAVIGQTLHGLFNTNTDIDFFSVSLVSGQHIVVAADSASVGGAGSLRIFAGDGQSALTFTTFDSSVNPPSGQTTGFPVGWEFTAPATGTYFISVSARGTAGGRYRLRTGFVNRGPERGRDQGDVFVGYSDDGITWSEPVRLSDDAPGFNAFVPEVAVAADGGVYCSWYDYRDAAPQTNGGEASVYLARSGDGGNAWSTLGAMSDARSNWSPGFTITNLLPNQGDYMTLFADSAYVWAVWSDARRGNPDVFAARTPLAPAGPPVPAQILQMAPPRPNPVVGGSFEVEFSLATDEPAELLLIDVSGREVMRRPVNLGKGPHNLLVPVPAGLNQGLYFLTVRQGDRNASSRACLVR
jgi:hypothetical protein